MSEQLSMPPEEGNNPSLEEEAQLQEQAQKASEDDGTKELLAGKFKDQDELVKAYKELESKLGSKDDSGSTEEQTDEATDQQSDTDATEDSQEAKVNDLLESVGVTRQEISEQWLANDGALNEETYKSFEEKGISKDLVDEFVSLKHQSAQVQQQQAEDKILGHVGGREAYQEMSQWAVQNLSEEEIQVYNSQTQGNDFMIAEQAVKGLYARYKAAGGLEPSLHRGKTSGVAKSDVYESVAQIKADMKDARYKNDEAFRQKVEDKIARSNVL